MLGVPTTTRRTLFKFGGATIIGAAVLAACGSDKDDARRRRATARRRRRPAPATTMSPATMQPDRDDGTTTPTAGDRRRGHGPRARPHRGVAGEAGRRRLRRAPAALLTTPAIKDAATMFAGHHQQHMDALNGVITKAGGKAVTEQNKAVYDALDRPGTRRGEDRGRRGEAGA